jgi:hypothetical protein
MKKTITGILAMLLVATLLVGLAACGKKMKNGIEGKYVIAEAYGESLPVNNSQNEFYEFKTDGTFLTNVYLAEDGSELAGTYAINGAEITLDTGDARIIGILAQDTLRFAYLDDDYMLFRLEGTAPTESASSNDLEPLPTESDEPVAVQNMQDIYLLAAGLATYLYETHPDRNEFDDILENPLGDNGEPYWTVIESALTNLATKHPKLNNKDGSITLTDKQMEAYTLSLFPGMNFVPERIPEAHEYQGNKGIKWDGVNGGYTLAPSYSATVDYELGNNWIDEDTQAPHLQFRIVEHITEESALFEIVLAALPGNLCPYGISSIKRIDPSAVSELTEEEAEATLRAVLESKGKMTAGTAILAVQPGEEKVAGQRAHFFAVGKDTPEKFTAEAHYAVLVNGDVYIMDVINGGDYIPYFVH